MRLVLDSIGFGAALAVIVFFRLFRLVKRYEWGDLVCLFVAIVAFAGSLTLAFNLHFSVPSQALAWHIGAAALCAWAFNELWNAHTGGPGGGLFMGVLFLLLFAAFASHGFRVFVLLPATQ